MTDTSASSFLAMVAGRRGHFRMESGYHSALWFDLDTLFSAPARVRPFVAALARPLRSHNIDAVCGPLLGGAFLAPLIADATGAEFWYTQPAAPNGAAGLFTARYELPPAFASRVSNKRVAIVDDVVSAGSSLRATDAELRRRGALVVAVGAPRTAIRFRVVVELYTIKYLTLDIRGPRFVAMNSRPADTSTNAPRLLWAAAATVAAFGSWMLFEALPGVNWLLWTGAAATGLVLFARPRGDSRFSVLITGAAATVIAGAAAVTASQPLSALICLAIMLFLAMQMLVAAGPSLRTVTLWFTLTAPFVALKHAAVHTMQHGTQATRLIRSPRARAWVRGLAITVPVLVVFALLLAGADPIFAAWRDAVANLFATWDFLPRAIFFVPLLVVVLGAYAYASAPPDDVSAALDQPHGRWLGSTERLILLAGIAALFWLFLAVQLGYFFGNLPSTPASGVTFAEYARRGFGELTVVASASALLIIGSERYGNDERESVLRVVTFAVIAAVLLLLASAFRRVLLYEAAYGFTTARLYAQVYMCAVATALLVLSLEVAGDFDAGRLFRRALTATTILFIGLVYWNHESWIARQNLDRFASTGKLDVEYLTRSLSPDAVPAIAERLAALPEPMRSEIRDAVRKQYIRRTGGHQRTWYEWNLATARAQQVIEVSFASP